jgi:RecA-family ATPase
MTRSAFMTLSEVEPEEVDWFWEPLIPYRMLTIMEGDPGIGKSYLAMHIAAEASRGGRLPNGDRLHKQRVLYFSAEDDPAFTIRPRIDAMGGDPDRIRFQAKYSPFNDRGLRQARSEVRETKPDLIIIDPLYAYVPADTEMYRPNQIRQLLGELNDLASHSDAAVLVIRHLTKAKHDKAMYQGAGSIDVIGVARSALLVAEDPEDSDVKVVAHIKHNLSARGDSWAFKLLQQEGQLPLVKWQGKSERTAEDLRGSPVERASARDAATEFLEEELEGGPMPAVEMSSAAEKRGIRKRTLDRAKAALGVITTKKGQSWFWSLPKR